jgi:hypothetical protein
MSLEKEKEIMHIIHEITELSRLSDKHTDILIKCITLLNEYMNTL